MFVVVAQNGSQHVFGLVHDDVFVEPSHVHSFQTVICLSVVGE